MFVFFAIVKRDAFGMIAHADKGITVVAVELFVFIVVTNQRVAIHMAIKVAKITNI